MKKIIILLLIVFLLAGPSIAGQLIINGYTNQEVWQSDGSGGATIPGNVTVRGTLQGKKQSTLSTTGTITLSASESGGVNSNVGATADVTYDLPVCSATNDGWYRTFRVGSIVWNMYINPGSINQILYLTDAPGEKIYGDRVPSSSITLMCGQDQTGTYRYIPMGYSGLWSNYSAKAISESFEATRGAVRTGFDFTPAGDWSEWVLDVSGGTVDEDANDIAAPSGGGGQMFKSVASFGDFDANATYTHALELPITYSRIYAYTASHSLVVNLDESLQWRLSAAAGDVIKFNIKNLSGQLVWRVSYYNNGAWAYFANTNTVVGQWDRLEAKYDATNANIQVKINGTSIGSAVLTGVYQSGVKKWKMGCLGGDDKAITEYFDLFDVSTTGWIGGN